VPLRDRFEAIRTMRDDLEELRREGLAARFEADLRRGRTPDEIRRKYLSEPGFVGDRRARGAMILLGRTDLATSLDEGGPTDAVGGEDVEKK